MNYSDVNVAIFITRRYLGRKLTVNKNRAKVRKSENSTPVLFAPVFFFTNKCTTVSKHRKIYDDTLLQQVYLQHGGNNF